MNVWQITAPTFLDCRPLMAISLSLKELESRYKLVFLSDTDEMGDLKYAVVELSGF